MRKVGLIRFESLACPPVQFLLNRLPFGAVSVWSYVYLAHGWIRVFRAVWSVVPTGPMLDPI